MVATPTFFHLFCYGTLKRGNKRSIENCYPDVQFVEKLTLTGFTLYKMPFRDVPVMVMASGEGNVVHGEVYLVSDEVLKQLDIREGVQKGWYTRVFRIPEGVYVYLWEHPTLFFKHIGDTFTVR